GCRRSDPADLTPDVLAGVVGVRHDRKLPFHSRGHGPAVLAEAGFAAAVEGDDAEKLGYIDANRCAEITFPTPPLHGCSPLGNEHWLGAGPVLAPCLPVPQLEQPVGIQDLGEVFEDYPRLPFQLGLRTSQWRRSGQPASTHSRSSWTRQRVRPPSLIGAGIRLAARSRHQLASERPHIGPATSAGTRRGCWLADWSGSEMVFVMG